MLRLIVAVVAALMRISTCTSQSIQLAVLYNNVVERTASEFAVDYTNRQMLANSVQLTMLEVNMIMNNTACSVLSNISGLVIPSLTQSSLEVVVQDIMEDIQIPTIVAQSIIGNFTTINNDMVTWRSTTDEILLVLQSFFELVSPTAVVLIESEGNITMPLGPLLPVILSDDVNITVVKCDGDDGSLSSVLENLSSTSLRNHSFVFIMNIPTYYADNVITKVNIATASWQYDTYRWLLMPHLTEHMINSITTGKPSWPLPSIVQGIQLNPLSTLEFTEYQEHWLSANKTKFPGSSFDNSEFAYDVYKAVVTMVDAITSQAVRVTPDCSVSSSNDTNTVANNSLNATNGDSGVLSSRNYTVWNLTVADMTKFGRWSKETGFVGVNTCTDINTESTSEDNTTQVDTGYQYNYTGLHFNVVTIQEEPFVMRNSTGELEGFCIDLLQILSDEMGFTYSVYEVEDGKYGISENGMWNGIIDDIVQQRANLSVAALTISSERIKAVDFTQPYIELGTLILLNKRSEDEFSLTRFAKPFSTALVIVFVVSWPVVGIVAWITAWISPYDRRALKKEKKVDAPYGFAYSIWAQFGSMMQQGSEYHPLSPASRTVVATWWFVVLILISSYTAHLAASLTRDTIANNIQSISDLVDQHVISYGTVNDSEVEEFFRTSNISTYRSALPTIRNNLFQSADDALNEVCNSGGTFGFIWDSVILESFISDKKDQCNLCLAGTLFNRKGYGIALPLNSSYTNDFTLAILELRERQTLLTLRNKWVSSDGGSQCEESQSMSYTITFVGDSFILLAICFVVSFAILFLEIIWKYGGMMKKVKGMVGMCAGLPKTNWTATVSDTGHDGDEKSTTDEGTILTPRDSSTQHSLPPPDILEAFVKHQPSS